MLDTLLHRIEHALFDLRGPLPRGAQWALRLLRYPYALAHDIARGELTLRAMSLVYTTLLSLVPLLALVFSVLKGLGFHRELEPILYQFLEPMGDRGYELTAQIMSFVDNARGDVLGSLGIAFLLYTAISMIQKVEESFNMVWRVAEPRSITRRIGEYLGVLMVGPAVAVAALGLIAPLGHIEPFATLFAWFGLYTPYFLVAGVFTFLYVFVPNTKVSLRAAFVGAVFAAVFWVGSGALFASFVKGTSHTMLIYAGFAVVILALIWLHISWLVLLVGAQLSFYVQHPQSLRPGSNMEHLTASLTERLALSSMYLVGQRFMQAGQHAQTARYFTLNSLAERMFIAVATLVPIVRRLESSGLIVVTDTESLVPGRDLDNITLADILDAVRSDRADRALGHIVSVPAADAVAGAVERAMRQEVQGKTLKDLIGERE